jgi:hypothetical protein
MSDGVTLFSRYAFPPNSLGYCGPEDSGLLLDLMAEAPMVAGDELRHVAQGFAGAWPYLTLIGGLVGRDPLDTRVVEAYWIGNSLLDRVDLAVWGNSLDDRFARRAGADAAIITDAAARGGVPTHAFHVFCVYPWVGLLRGGATEQALAVIDSCRIRWGTIRNAAGDDRFVVSSQPLTWDGRILGLGQPEDQFVHAPVDRSVVVNVGDTVSLHWDYVCDRLTRPKLAELQSRHNNHLALVNAETRRLDKALAG